MSAADNVIKRDQYATQFVKNIAYQIVTPVLQHRTTRIKPLNYKTTRLGHGVGQPTTVGIDCSTCWM